MASHKKLVFVIISILAIFGLAMTTATKWSFAEPACDSSLWNHVYNPNRLQIVKDCVTVTGTVMAVRSEADGDYHILVALDAPFANMTNSANDQYQHGDLVVEPVCEHAITQADALVACSGFSGGIARPAIGSHVIVTGSYVLDRDHSLWAEIHPATSIQLETTPEFAANSSFVILGISVVAVAVVFRTKLISKERSVFSQRV